MVPDSASACGYSLARSSMAGNGRINGRGKTHAKSVLLLASVAALCASCGGGSATVSVPAPQQAVAPGYDSPQAAVAGYLTGYSDNDRKKICAYVAPPQEEYCNFLFGPSLDKSLDNSLTTWRLGDSLVRGNEAVVVVIADKWCIAKVCVANKDPKKGLPRTNRGFERAFDKTTNWLPAVSVVQVEGKWYVALA
jgi:hypothetical protein